MVVEFYGLPGSGKSSVAEPVVKKLREKGFRVLTYTDLNSSYNNGFGLVLKNLNLTFLLLQLFLREKMIINKRRVSYIKLILQTSNFYKNSSGADYVIMEQGILQNVISLYYDHEIRDTGTLKKIFQTVRNEMLPVVTEIDCEEAFKRMLTREKEPGRLDGLDGEKQRKVYQIYENNIRKFENVFTDFVKIDTSIDPQTNAETILKKIIV